MEKLDTVTRITKNIVFLLFSSVFMDIFSFIFNIYSVRYLGPKNFGIISFSLAFTDLFGIFFDFGLNQLTIREVAKNKKMAFKYLYNIQAIKMFISIIVSSLILFIAFISGYERQIIVVLGIITISSVIRAFSSTFTSIFRAFENMKYETIGTIIYGLSRLAGLLGIIVFRLNVVYFAFIYLLSSLVMLLYLMHIAIKNSLIPKLQIDFYFWKMTIREALPFAISSVFITIYYRIDSVMLSFMKGATEVGIYNAAYKLILPFNIIPSVIIGSLFPTMSQYYANSSQDAFSKAFRYPFKYLLIISIPISVGISILAKRFIILLYGNEYLQSYSCLQILIWSEVLVFLNIALANVFNSRDKQIVVSMQTGISALFNLITNAIFIPRYSFIGASYTTVATELLGFLFLYFKTLRILDDKLFPRTFIVTLVRVIAASLLMGFFLRFFEKLNVFLLVVLSIFLYFGTIYLLKSIDKDELNLIRKILFRNYKGKN